MEANERLPKETKGTTKERNQAWDEVQSVLNKEEVEEVDFLQPYLHLLSPSLTKLLSTNKHLGRPREMAMCVQGPDESLCDYLMYWTELRNNCEGVHEVHAIQYFYEGCHDGTLLKHKLMCSEIASLVDLMIKEDK
ncbi:Endoglucanase 3 [Hordeum vulgare]|nr:Endoglucanase 3 [Hordeum vulgare]